MLYALEENSEVKCQSFEEKAVDSPAPAGPRVVATGEVMVGNARRDVTRGSQTRRSKATAVATESYVSAAPLGLDHHSNTDHEFYPWLQPAAPFGAKNRVF